MRNQSDEIRFLTGMLMQLVWNPDLFRYHPHARKKRQLMLYYRAKGVVMHDRELNRENIEVVYETH